MIGVSWPHIVLRSAAATLGVIMLSAALIGYLRGPTRLWERALLFAGSFLLIFPGVWSDLAGLLCFVVVVITQRRGRFTTRMDRAQAHRHDESPRCSG